MYPFTVVDMLYTFRKFLDKCVSIAAQVDGKSKNTAIGVICRSRIFWNYDHWRFACLQLMILEV